MKFRLIACFFMMIAPVLCDGATTTFNNGFESGTLSGFSCSGNCPGVNAASKLHGNYGGDFDLTRSMSVPYRTEVTLGNPGSMYVGNEYWFGFNFRHADWANDGNSEIAPIQQHLVPQTFDPECAESAVGIAPFYMLSQSSVVKFQTYGSIVRWSASVNTTTWRSIVVHFIPSRTSSGLIEAWVDNVKVATVNGANIDALDKCERPYLDRSYLKMGIYKWDWKAGRPATESTRRRLFIDNIKIASGTNGYNNVYTAVDSSEPPVTPLTISGIQTTVTDTSATVFWNTSEAANGLVQYGLTSSYGSNQSVATKSFSHAITLPGLPASTLHHYKITSDTLLGKTATSSDLTFTTSATPTTDTTPPVITNFQARDITPTSARLSYDTDEPATTRFKWTWPANTTGLTFFDSQLVTYHERIIENLPSNTVFNVKLSSVDGAGNPAIESVNNSFTTPPISTAPVLSNFGQAIGKTTATFTWDTVGVSSDSVVNYGTTDALGGTESNASLVTSHSIQLSGLNPNTTYKFIYSSTNSAGTTTSSALAVFKTLKKSGMITDLFNSFLNKWKYDDSVIELAYAN